ncbi:helix-turn-helix transcriptional regulator [Globicatella sulfidifaciens]|uniref:Predicted transcriptional regulators n=1 Tax=Globicatella sulfidifaciens DSM 15739 TaxID=1121925 RepID=A0A1T4L9M4_9LACT|nr:helix-turn-helix transcriptional regulator [Globicatella sulfidifaciens]SJZ51334.1 Predicted transcriptional regulators [Globicatella sulfidifaciens DSM 15739]
MELNYNKFVQSMSEAMIIGRKRKKLNQSEVAKLLGISRGHYSDLENGKTIPSLVVALKINEIFPFFSLINDADRVSKDLS